MDGLVRTQEHVCTRTGGVDPLLMGCDDSKEDDGISPIFVGVVAAMLSALITAVAVGAACRFCGGADDDDRRQA